MPGKAAIGARSLAAQQRHPAPRILRNHLGPDPLQKWGLLVAKKARRGCPKRPLSAPEIRLISDSAPCNLRLLFKASPMPFLEPNVGRTGCKKCKHSAPEEAVFGTPSLAAQPNDSAPRNLCPFSKVHFWCTFEGQALYRNGGLLAAKSAPKGRFRRPKSGCPITRLITQNSAPFSGRTSDLPLRANSQQKWGLLGPKSA